MASQPQPQAHHQQQLGDDLSTDAESTQYDVEKNIISLIELPWKQCPWPSVRLGLLRIAIEGAEIYAYRPAFSKRWVIWHRQPHPATDARFSPRYWAIKYGYLAAPEDTVDDTNDKEG